MVAMRFMSFVMLVFVIINNPVIMTHYRFGTG